LKNELKKKLYDGKVSFGCWLTIANPDVVDMLKQLPFDWFVFDTEHSYLTIEDVKNMQMALSDSAACPIVRVGMIDQLLIKRALDIGSQGLLMPLVNTSEDATAYVKFSRYPPAGIRGAGPGRAARYGSNLGEYLRTANSELLLAAQIETTQALSNLDAIVGTEGIDVAFVGPTDMTMSLGLVDDRWNPKVLEAMGTVVRACQKYGKIPGTLAISPEEANKWVSLGFRFVGLGSDARHLVGGARAFLQAVQK
jgi:2-dehydro-3-deoxyglucarate aldolase